MSKPLLRTETVDISRYLPAFLFNDGHFKAVCDACSWEHEKVRQAILDVLDQFFVGTATWGLAMWERTLDIHPRPEENYGYRRKKILAKLQGQQTSTVAMMEKIVNVYGYGYVEEHNSQYYFNIYTTSQSERELKEMEQQIMFYKPAHLGINVYLGFSWNSLITFNGQYTYGTSNREWE